MTTPYIADELAKKQEEANKPESAQIFDKIFERVNILLPERCQVCGISASDEYDPQQQGDICPRCGWEVDPLNDDNDWSYANNETLGEAKERWNGVQFRR